VHIGYETKNTYHYFISFFKSKIVKNKAKGIPLGQELSCGLNRKFGELFDSAVDKAMVLLGESGRQATYYYLEKILGLERGRWHNHVEEFAEAVEQIFGSGAQLLLKAIAKELYLNLGLEFDEPKKFNFAKLVREAERYFLTTRAGGGFIEKEGKGVGKRRK
jgi:hypothetical protein